MSTIIETTLMNGKKVKLNTRLSLFVLGKAQREGLMRPDFLTQIAKLSQGQSIDVDNIEMNDVDWMNLPYLCYLQNGNCEMGYEEFMSNMTLDPELFYKLVVGMVDGFTAQASDSFKKEFYNSTPKTKKKNKKKYQKSK